MTPRGKRVLPLALCLVLVLMLGGFLSLRLQRRAHVRDEAAQLQEVAQLRQANRDLRLRPRPADAADGEAAAAKTDPAPAPASPARIQAAVELVRSGLLGAVLWPPIFPDGLNSPPQGYGNSLSANFEKLAVLLDLNPAETEALRRTVSDGEREFSRAVAASARVRREGETVVVEIQDRTRMQAAFDQMQQSIADILGPQRHEMYEVLGGRKAVADTFNKWGLNGYTLSAWRGAPRGQPDRPMLMFNQAAALPPGVDPRGGGMSGVLDRDGLRTNVGPLEALLPADF